MTARDYIAHRVEVGDITIEEGDVLQKLANVVEKDLRGEELLDKEAGIIGSVAKAGREFMGSSTPSKLVHSFLAGAGLAAANMAYRGSKKLMIDPAIEQLRFRRMNNLPGIDSALEIRSPSQNRFYVDPDLEDDESRRQIIRKAFGMLNDFAPEISRSPELAAEVLKTTLDSDPVALYTTSTDLANQTNRLQKARAMSPPNPFWYDAAKEQVHAQLGLDSPQDQLTRREAEGKLHNLNTGFESPQDEVSRREAEAKLRGYNSQSQLPLNLGP